MSDNKSCTLFRGALAVVVDQNEQLIVLIGSKHFPGTEVFIRVDEKTARKSSTPSFDHNESMIILDEINNGSSIKTRYTQWPKRTNVDDSLSTYGFKEALDYAIWATKRIK